MDLIIPILLTFVFSWLVPFLFVTYLPQAKVKAIGLGWGRKLSKWSRSKFGKENWENVENSILSTVLLLVQSILEGADEDDNTDAPSGRS